MYRKNVWLVHNVILWRVFILSPILWFIDKGTYLLALHFQSQYRQYYVSMAGKAKSPGAKSLARKFLRFTSQKLTKMTLIGGLPFSVNWTGVIFAHWDMAKLKIAPSSSWAPVVSWLLDDDPLKFRECVSTPTILFWFSASINNHRISLLTYCCSNY